VFLLRGVIPLSVYGLYGTIEQTILAPGDAQIPLVFGFTIETPFSSPPMAYRVGERGVGSGLQWEAHLAGQRVFPGLPLRTHTTGLVDCGVRNGVPGSVEALELIHPGRAAQISLERELTMIDPAGAVGAASAAVVGAILDIPGINFDEPGAPVASGYIGVGPDPATLRSEAVSSALGFASPRRGSFGGLVNDYTTSRIWRI